MLTILIVDDDHALTAALAIRLRHAGFAVHAANSADEATDMALRERPDLILLDVDMPHYTGPEFHECLAMVRRVQDTPVVYMSGHDTHLVRRIACEQGAAAFITKPFESSDLISTLQRILAARCSANH